ncbi:outer membrane beta-barrel protein [candidate division KSB1 bacterium]|nr:outer membrane beta-barrel protein [candidate division KSB1 bacterium]
MIKKYFILIFFLILFFNAVAARALDDKFGIGLKLGATRLEGDWEKPTFSPNMAVYFSYSPIPYFSVGGQVDYTSLRTKSFKDVSGIHPDNLDPFSLKADKLKTTAIPFEFEFQLNLMPFNRIKPFALIGAGGLWYQTTYDKNLVSIDGFEQKMLDSIIKVGAGLEYTFENNIGVSIGTDIRFSLTDRLDQIKSGDENDGIISIWTGVNYYIHNVDKKDLDHDFIPVELDLDPVLAEDNNGYLDHDGKPEGGVPLDFDYKKPLIKHFPVFRAEEGRDFKVTAQIFATTPLKTSAVLYRTMGTKKWNVQKLEPKKDNNYIAVIDKSNIDPRGLEYFIVAVSQDLKGIGNSGLPKRPIQVKVIKDALIWRIASATVTTIGWGLATFFVLRKQSN